MPVGMLTSPLPPGRGWTGRRAGRARKGAGPVAPERYGVTEIAQFGSLADGDDTGTLDVDLAVRGLDGLRYFEAVADLMALFGGSVDLVRLEEAGPSLAQRIAESGRPL